MEGVENKTSPLNNKQNNAIVEEVVDTEMKYKDPIYTVDVAAFKNAANYDASQLVSVGRI